MVRTTTFRNQKNVPLCVVAKTLGLPYSVVYRECVFRHKTGDDLEGYRMSRPMNVYECRRWHPDGWSGILLIAAASEEEAVDVYLRYEQRPPVEIIQVPDVMAVGEPRLILEAIP